jgi:hypothetical protein
MKIKPTFITRVTSTEGQFGNTRTMQLTQEGSIGKVVGMVMAVVFTRGMWMSLGGEVPLTQVTTASGAATGQVWRLTFVMTTFSSMVATEEEAVPSQVQCLP